LIPEIPNMHYNLAGCASAALLIAFSTPAFAHVTLEKQEAAVGSTYRAVVRVPHGCGSEATNVLRVQIPDGFYAVKPMPHAGWTLETVIGPYAQPYDNYGTIMTEGVVEVIWSGGELPNEFYDEFIFRGTFGGDLPVGSVFYFPAVQECANGEEAWIDTTGAEDAEKPAPHLTLIAAPSN
jgi:uncharacterized protein YcnI